MIVYVRGCLATTLKGKPCRNINYVNRDGRCPSHRNADKFPISDEAAQAMVDQEIIWDLYHQSINRYVADFAKRTADEIRAGKPGS